MWFTDQARQILVISNRVRTMWEKKRGRKPQLWEAWEPPDNPPLKMTCFWTPSFQHLTRTSRLLVLESNVAIQLNLHRNLEIRSMSPMAIVPKQNSIKHILYKSTCYIWLPFLLLLVLLLLLFFFRCIPNLFLNMQ